MQEICKSCEIKDPCLDKSPINMHGFIPENWRNCVRYSGKRHQDQALLKRVQRPEIFDIENGVIKGWLFGTPDKPTDSKLERFNKFVSLDGVVYIFDKRDDRIWRETGQHFWKK